VHAGDGRVRSGEDHQAEVPTRGAPGCCVDSQHGQGHEGAVPADRNGRGGVEAHLTAGDEHGAVQTAAQPEERVPVAGKLVSEWEIVVMPRPASHPCSITHVRCTNSSCCHCLFVLCYMRVLYLLRIIIVICLLVRR
jgi:hypothetical protein